MSGKAKARREAAFQRKTDRDIERAYAQAKRRVLAVHPQAEHDLRLKRVDPTLPYVNPRDTGTETT